MRERRGLERREDLCSGPGKLTQALGIGLDLNGTRARASRSRSCRRRTGAEPQVVVGGADRHHEGRRPALALLRRDEPLASRGRGRRRCARTRSGRDGSPDWGERRRRPRRHRPASARAPAPAPGRRCGAGLAASGVGAGAGSLRVRRLRGAGASRLGLVGASGPSALRLGSAGSPGPAGRRARRARPGCPASSSSSSLPLSASRALADADPVTS